MKDMKEHYGAIQLYDAKLYFIVGICFGIVLLIKFIFDKAPLKKYLEIFYYVGFLWLSAAVNYFSGKKILRKKSLSKNLMIIKILNFNY